MLRLYLPDSAGHLPENEMNDYFWNHPQWARMTATQQALAIFLRCQALGIDWRSQAAQQMRRDAGATAVTQFDVDLAIASAMVS
jgi:hypothetical protein